MFKQHSLALSPRINSTYTIKVVQKVQNS